MRSLPVRLLQMMSCVCDGGDEQTRVRMLTLAFPLSRPLMGRSGRVRQAVCRNTVPLLRLWTQSKS